MDGRYEDNSWLVMYSKPEEDEFMKLGATSRFLTETDTLDDLERNIIYRTLSNRFRICKTSRETHVYSDLRYPFPGYDCVYFYTMGEETLGAPKKCCTLREFVVAATLHDENGLQVMIAMDAHHPSLVLVSGARERNQWYYIPHRYERYVILGCYRGVPQVYETYPVQQLLNDYRKDPDDDMVEDYVDSENEAVLSTNRQHYVVYRHGDANASIPRRLLAITV